jgi:hypothetical protein
MVGDETMPPAPDMRSDNCGEGRLMERNGRLGMRQGNR